MRLLHPFMPFLTEALWQQIPHDGASIMVSDWPKMEESSALSVDSEAGKWNKGIGIRSEGQEWDRIESNQIGFKIVRLWEFGNSRIGCEMEDFCKIVTLGVASSGLSYLCVRKYSIIRFSMFLKTL